MSTDASPGPELTIELTEVVDIERERPFMPAAQRRDLAVKRAGREWRELLASKRIPDCPAHLLSAQNYQQGVDLAIAWIKAVPAAVAAVSPTSPDPIVQLAWSLLHDAVQVRTEEFELENGQARVCQARLFGVQALPVRRFR